MQHKAPFPGVLVLTLLCVLFASMRVASAAETVWPSGLTAHAVINGLFPAQTQAGCCWMGARAVLHLPRPSTKTMLVRIAIPPYAAAPDGTSLTFRVNDMPPQARCCYGPGEHELAFTLGNGRRDEPLTVIVDASPPFVPIERGISPDRRSLTVLFRSLAPLHPYDRFRGSDEGTGGSPVHLVIALIGLVAAAFGAHRRPLFAWLLPLVTDPFSFPYHVAGTTVTLPKAILLGVIVGLATRRDVRAAVKGLSCFLGCQDHATGAGRGHADDPKGIYEGRRLGWISVPFVAFVVSMLLSASAPADHGAAFRETLKAAQYALTFIVVFLAYRLDSDDVLLIRAVAVTASSSALLALAQLRFGVSESTILAGHEIARVAGPLEGPNQLAAFLGFALPVIAVRAFSGKPAWPERIAFALAVIASAATISRSGIIAEAFALGIFFVVRAKPNALRDALVFSGATWSAIAAGVLAAVSGIGLFPRIFGGENDAYAGGLGNRVELWRGALTLWREHPWLGVGPGNYELRIGELLPGVSTHANGYYVHVLAEQGIFGALAFLALTGGMIVVLARGAARPLVLAVLAAALGLALHQLVDGFFLYPKVGVFVWTLVGIAAAASCDPLPRRASSHRAEA